MNPDLYITAREVGEHYGFSRQRAEELARLRQIKPAIRVYGRVLYRKKDLGRFAPAAAPEAKASPPARKKKTPKRKAKNA